MKKPFLIGFSISLRVLLTLSGHAHPLFKLQAPSFHPIRRLIRMACSMFFLPASRTPEGASPSGTLISFKDLTNAQGSDLDYND
jgi:hypothetical protein